jgi:type I restriction enzyme S subunit
MRKGWELKPLKEIATFSQGIQVGLEKHETVQKEGYVRFIRIIDYTQNTEDIRYIPNPGEKYYVNEDDIVMVRYGSPGLVGRGKAGVIANNLFKITILRNDIKNDYLTHFLSQDNIQKYLSSQGASTMPALNFGQLGKIEISFPININEQQEIVSILDDAFESIERAKSNAEKNLNNARELFDSYLQNIFEKGNWVETTLEKLSNKKDAVVSGPFGSNLKVSDYKEKGVPILRLQNIGKGFFINKSIKFITKEKAEELKYHSFKSGDIALAKLGIPIGKTCIIPESFEDGIITADIVRIRPDKNIINYKFLEYFLNTNISVAQLTGNISGATRPRVNLSDVRNIKLTLPKLQEQKDIVGELDNLTMKINKLEEILNRKINSLDELKKSILQKAFNGELKTTKISA